MCVTLFQIGCLWENWIKCTFSLWTPSVRKNLLKGITPLKSPSCHALYVTVLCPPIAIRNIGYMEHVPYNLYAMPTFEKRFVHDPQTNLSNHKYFRESLGLAETIVLFCGVGYFQIWITHVVSWKRWTPFHLQTFLQPC